MSDFIFHWLTNQGLAESVAKIFEKIIALSIVFILAFISYFIVKRFALRGITKFALNTKNKWDDFLVERKVFSRLSFMAPALTIYFAIPLILEADSQLSVFIKSLTLIYMIIAAVLALNSLLDAVLDIYQTFPISKKIPINAFIQVAKILLYFTCVILFVSVLLNKTPLYLLSGLGALTAVLMLVFKDAVLGFGAGIHLTLNKMVAQGDWIEMPKYEANGEVMEVSLTTVKVQNWDKTISSIPAYAMVGDSFKNWRGMSESGGRRIKRAIYIDMNSIKFCDSERLSKFFSNTCLSEYIEPETGAADISRNESNSENEISGIINKLFFDIREPVTNLGVFRAYARAYLKKHPLINQEMTFLVRQLSPTPHGLPVEIYVFCKDQVWSNYETIQAEIFERLLAMLPEFDLRVFQNPGGKDLQDIAAAR